MKPAFISLSFFLLLFILNCSPQQKKNNWAATTAKSFIAKTPDPDSIHWVGQSNHFTWQAGYCIGIKNSYADYISQPKEVSPFAAFGSFIIGTCIVER